MSDMLHFPNYFYFVREDVYNEDNFSNNIVIILHTSWVRTHEGWTLSLKFIESGPHVCTVYCYYVCIVITLLRMISCIINGSIKDSPLLQVSRTIIRHMKLLENYHGWLHGPYYDSTCICEWSLTYHNFVIDVCSIVLCCCMIWESEWSAADWLSPVMQIASASMFVFFVLLSCGFQITPQTHSGWSENWRKLAKVKTKRAQSKIVSLDGHYGTQDAWWYN